MTTQDRIAKIQNAARKDEMMRMQKYEQKQGKLRQLKKLALEKAEIINDLLSINFEMERQFGVMKMNVLYLRNNLFGGPSGPGDWHWDEDKNLYANQWSHHLGFVREEMWLAKMGGGCFEPGEVRIHYDGEIEFIKYNRRNLDIDEKIYLLDSALGELDKFAEEVHRRVDSL